MDGSLTHYPLPPFPRLPFPTTTTTPCLPSLARAWHGGSRRKRRQSAAYLRSRRLPALRRAACLVENVRQASHTS